VFRIDPKYSLPGTGTIEPVLRKAGSLILDLARNPDGGEMWILSTDSLNKTTDVLGNPDNDTEPELRGRFAINQLVRVPGLTSGTVLDGIAPASYGVTDLDRIGAGYVKSRSVNQARTVVFMGGTGANRGDAFVASAQSDVIVRLDKDGNRLADLVLPARSQCFSLAKRPGDPFLAALCLGTMTVEVFNLTTGQRMPGLQRSIGLDPTPAQIRRGRDVFLDGQLSMDGRFSCASCHPRGMTDGLVWGLRGNPTDVKDIMVTQSLFSIADTFPHHWRGERDLDDFKKAFGGLLGADEGQPTSVQMEDLVVFFQSLQAPANPIENPRRVLDDLRGTTSIGSGPNLPAGLGPEVPSLIAASSAVAGQNVFRDEVSFNGKTCLECHSFENGSDSSHMTEGFLVRAPRAMPIEMAHLRQMQLRGKDSFGIRTNLPLLGDVEIPVNRNGAGFLHDGREPTLLHFLANNFVELPTAQMRVNAFRFTEQFDQGISPAAHWGQLYSVGTVGVIPIQIETNIKEILVDGANRGWNDVVAFGLSDPDDGGSAFGLVPMRWFFDTSLSTPAFVSDHPSQPNRTWAQMKTKTRAGFAKNVFLGVAPGSGRRFGIDRDRDGLKNGVEVPIAQGGFGTDPWNPNSDGASGVDVWPDGYEVDHGDDPLMPQSASSDNTSPSIVTATLDFRTSRLAKYHIRFSEDVTYTVTYSTPGGPERTFVRNDFVRDDTFVLTHDEPSTPDIPGVTAADVNDFDVFVQATDRKGKPLTLTLPGVPIGGFDSDVVHFVDFNAVGPISQPVFNLHVSEVARVGPPVKTSSTMALNLRVKVDYNYGGPFYAPKPADDRMVFGSIAVKRMGTPDFVKVNLTPNSLGVSFSTSLTTGFNVFRPNVAPPNQTVPYGLAPGGDWICSPHTVNEEAIVSFTVAGLQPGDQVRYSVMGVLTPSVAGTSGTYTEESLQELQPVLREDSMEHDETF
jgi:hypothetical protein